MRAIEAVNLTKRFGPLTAVDNLTLQIEQGEIFGFLGPNGAGKSTTIRMLCGILTPTSGQARVGAFDVRTQAEKVKEVIGYVSQSFGLYSDLTVEENLHFYARIFLARERAEQRVTEVIDALGFHAYRSTLALHLSGGWRQRLALACAIAHDPEILFLDEPTAGIDPVSRRTLWDILYQLAYQGKTLFVTTHYMEEAERCHRIGFIWQGRLVACDSPQGIKEHFRLGEIVSLRCSPLHSGFATLRDAPAVKDVNIYGEELHVLVERAKDTLPALSALLAARGIAVEEIRQISPSIEDVFVALSKAE